jgi:hypothetical protein
MKAFAQSPLLSHRERMGYLDKQVAAGANRPASLPGGYNAVHSGDTRRHREYLKQQLRQQEGLAGVNAKLETLIGQVGGLVGQ